MLPLLFNKDVMTFLIKMKYRQYKKDFITKGGWRTKKSILIYLFLAYAIYNYVKHHGWLPKKSLKGEHVFLTGAGSGLGRLMAIEFAKQGCNLSLSDINMEGLEETKR